MEKRLLLVNSLPESGFVPRGPTAFDIFRGGVSPVETDMGEIHTAGPRMRRSDVFEIAD